MKENEVVTDDALDLTDSILDLMEGQAIGDIMVALTYCLGDVIADESESPEQVDRFIDKVVGGLAELVLTRKLCESQDMSPEQAAIKARRVMLKSQGKRNLSSVGPE